MVGIGIWGDTDRECAEEHERVPYEPAGQAEWTDCAPEGGRRLGDTPTPSPTLNESLALIIVIVSSIVAVCNDNLPPASVQQGNEILCGLGEVRAMPEVTKESRLWLS